MAEEITPGDEPPAEQPKYDQAFFLALAAKGKDAWNAWRRDLANKNARVTFAGINFSEAPRDKIDFSGFEFGDHADFSRCKWRGGKRAEEFETFWPGGACFAGAVFGNQANFTGAVFGNRANFTRAIFGGWAKFSGADFGWVANFTRARFDRNPDFFGAAFGDCANFINAAFGWQANFKGGAFDGEADFTGADFKFEANFTSAVFGDKANFKGSIFGPQADFTGAAFGNWANFRDTIFKGRVEFTGQSEEQWTDLENLDLDEEARKALEKRLKESWKHFGSGPDRFLTISFANARFGEAVFSSRAFVEATDFTQARFYYPPNFDAAAKDARIDFTGAHIGFVPPGRLHWTSETEVPVRMRALRKIAEDTKNHDLERDLYIEERKAERGVYWHQLVEELKKAPWIERPLITWRLIGHVCWIVVMGVYWAFADYGRNFVLPAAWLAASVWLFHRGYAAILARLMPQTDTLDAAKYARAEWMVALGNAVPFVGPLTIDAEIKKFLFCPGFGKCLPLPPEGFQALVIGQNLFSIILVFFIGLALRNYFKIK